MIFELIRNEKWYIISGIFFISLFPASLLSGSAVINIFSILIIIFFIINVNIYKIIIFKDYYFYLLLIFWISLFINLLFSNFFFESLSRVVGFGKYILLVYAIKYFFCYKNFKFEKLIIISWLIIYLVVSLDLVIEYITKLNNSENDFYYPGRLSGFLGDKLKIGNYYCGFILISISTIIYLFKKKYLHIILILIIFVLIGYIIGERANFIKLFFISIFFLIFSQVITKKQIFLFFLICVFIIFAITKSDNNFNTRLIGQVFVPIFKNGYTNYLKEVQHGAHRNAAKLIFKDNIYFGSGIKTFRFESKKEKYENNKYNLTALRSSTHPHQVHWELISETGIFGYTVFLLFFILIFFNSIKIFCNNKNLFILSSLLFIISSLLPIIPSGSFFTTYTATIFWLNFSLLLIYKEKERI